MLTMSSKRPRMIFDCSEAMRRAINVRASKRGGSPSDVIVEALSLYFGPDELREAEQWVAESGEAPPSRRGRKPKPRKP